jgi:long-chain acyl-CoA synthetase
VSQSQNLNFHVDESSVWFREESGWPEEVPKNMEFPRTTLGEMLRQAAQRWPDHVAMWFLGSTMTYRELDRHVDALATSLHELGVKKGDVVAMLLPNSFQYVIGYYAVTRLGAVVSGLNPTYKPNEILHQIKTIGARTLICLDALYEEKVAPILEKTEIKALIGTNVADFLPFVKRALGKMLKKIPTGPMPTGTLRLLDLLSGPINPPKVEIDAVEEAATYIMTGGTTGVPKAAVLTHFNCVSNALQCKAWLYKVEPGVGDVGILPFFHSFAMTTVMNLSVAYGGLMILFPKPPTMEEYVKTLQAVGPKDGSCMVGAEILFQKMTDYLEKNPKLKVDDKLILCVSGAGPLHRHVQERFEEITKARLVEGYGLTEASPVVSAGPFWPAGERKVGTIGLPFPGTDWRIVDKTDPSKSLGVGEGPEDTTHIGEIAVAGPQVMKGYLDQPEETAETIVEMDGKRWLLTGDIGYMDETGQIVILDRKKQLIKHKGYSVFPKEVESLMGMNPSISEVAVAGLPDEETGEVIKAWVVLKEEHRGKVTETELAAWAKENLTHYKVPRYVEIRDELPKTLVGKVLRRELQEADPIWKAAKSREASRGE